MKQGCGVPPFAGGESAYFISLNRNKRSLTLNIKKEHGREILRKLLAQSDVLVENYRMGTLDKMGFGYDEVGTINPGIIYCSITGYGRSGPLSGEAGVDIVVAAEAGPYRHNRAEGWSARQGGCRDYGYPDSAVCGRVPYQTRYTTGRRREKGQRVDLSLFESRRVSTLFNMSSNYLISGTDSKKMGAFPRKHSALPGLQDKRSGVYARCSDK